MGLEVFRVLFGCILLVAGRRVFWLSVALIGFLLGAELAAVALVGKPAWLGMVVAAATGVVGAVLAVLVERIAFALVGFSAGGYVGVLTVGLLGMPDLGLAGFVAGAVLGTIVAVMATDWAIIVLTSAVGAAAVAGALEFGSSGMTAATIVLAAVGIAVQSATRPAVAWQRPQ
jgi:hypothetical protein